MAKDHSARAEGLASAFVDSRYPGPRRLSSARTSKRWIWATTVVVVLVAIMLSVFAVWAVRLVSSVADLRGQVETRVGWLQALTMLDADLRSAEATSAEATARLQALSTEIVADPATGPDLAAQARGLGLGASTTADAVSAELAALVPAIRRETAMVSVALGERWDAIYRLTAVSLLLAVSTLMSLIYIRYVVLMRVQARLTGLESHLHRADRLAAVGTLAAGVAHEINNPLGYALMSLQLAKEQAPGGELESLIDEALEGANRVQGIVADLREVASPRADELEAFDVGEAVEAALKVVSTRLRGQIEVVRAFDPTPPVLAARARIEQVCLNLLLNAADAIEDTAKEGSSEACGQLIVRTQKLGKRRVLLEIEDTGGGLAPEVAGRVFEPFVTSKPVGKGTGLGLFVSRNIVESFDGTLTLERTPHGTAARVVLPVA